MMPSFVARYCTELSHQLYRLVVGIALLVKLLFGALVHVRYRVFSFVVAEVMGRMRRSLCLLGFDEQKIINVGKYSLVRETVNHSV